MDQPSPSSAASSPVPSAGSRDAALAALAAAGSMGELFDAAQGALGPARLSWGDCPAQSAAAQTLWDSCQFAVACDPAIHFLARGDLPVQIPGRKLLAQSFSTAKRIASALSRPLPPSPGADALAGAIAEVHAAEADAANALISMREPAPRGLDLLRLGKIGSSCVAEIHASAYAKVGDEPGNGGGPVETAKMMENSDPEGFAAGSRASPPADPQAGAPFQALVEEAGFRRAMASPHGGWAQACQEAEAALRACAALGQAWGADARIASLGGLSIQVNSPADDGALAAFSPWAYGLRMGRGGSCLGHEWTHALEHLVDQAGDARAKDSLEAARRTIQRQGPAPDSVEAGRLALNLPPILAERHVGLFIASKGSLRGASEPEREAERARIMEELRGLAAGLIPGSFNYSDEWGCRWRRDALEIFNRRRDPACEPVNPAGVDWIVDELISRGRTAGAFERFVAEGASAFRSFGLALEAGEHYMARRYWSQPLEMLARVAEAYYLGRDPQTLLAGDPGESFDDRSGRAELPQGSERAELVASYGEWIRSSLPWLRQVCARAPEPVDVAGKLREARSAQGLGKASSPGASRA